MAPEPTQPADGSRDAPAPVTDLRQLADALGGLRRFDQPPEQIGPYRILELIGEGGMGAVYKAEQRDPIRRTVALKLIKLGMDTKQVVARFESERQALALMSHPNVAAVHDAGATESGRPYFVMEYVKGEPITEFADRHKLTTRQRLELFLQACDAIQHAHQKAIIHRDLKPTNILVTLADAKPLVKVIDFGVAKATAQRLTERTLFTESGQLVGTPEYMSPEQAEGSGLDVDTRSDVYSLGVVLYELLAGALPFEAATLRSAGYAEIQRIIRDVDPPRPSTRLSKLGAGAAGEVAQRRRTQLAALERELRGELEWIPLKAMRKDRADRYASATELADDIRNYLASRPLRAGPERAAYRLKKFLRRNKGGVAASAAMVFLLLVGIVATSWQALRATRAERRARDEKRDAEHANANTQAVNAFLTEDLLQSADPGVSLGEKLTVKQALDAAARSVGERFKGRPLTEASVRLTLAMTYKGLGRGDLALPHAEASLETRRALLGPDHPDTIVAAAELSEILTGAGRFTDAERVARDAYERGLRALGEGHRHTMTSLRNLARATREQGRLDEAESLYRQALARSRAHYGADDSDTVTATGNLAALLFERDRFDEAEALAREAAARMSALVGPRHPHTLSAVNNVALFLRVRGKLDEAEAPHREVLAHRREVLGEDHPDTLASINNLGTLLGDLGKPDEAFALLREAVERTRALAGADHPDALLFTNNLAFNLHRAGRSDEAEGLYKQALDGRRRALGELHHETLNTTSNLAALYEERKQYAQAEPLYASLCRPEALATFPVAQHGMIIARRGLCLARLGRDAEAEPLLLDADRRLREAGQLRGNSIRLVARTLASLYDRTNRPDEAARWRAELAKLEAATRPATQPTTAPAPATR